MENNSPYQSERQLWVTVDDILGADVDQLDLNNFFFFCKKPKIIYLFMLLL